MKNTSGIIVVICILAVLVGITTSDKSDSKDISSNQTITQGYSVYPPYPSVEREKRDCSLCGGSGQKKCRVCDGSGDNSIYDLITSPVLKSTIKPYCEACDGNGWIKCGGCQGSGKR